MFIAADEKGPKLRRSGRCWPDDMPLPRSLEPTPDERSYRQAAPPALQHEDGIGSISTDH